MPSRISLKVGAIFFGFLLLALTEGIIRLTGIWENHPNPVSLPVNWADGHLPSAGRLTAPLLVEEGKEVITSTQLKPFMPTRKFKKSKKPTTKRIFSFGGSSTLGVPVEATPAKTFPGQLQLQLQSLGINAESINLGGASFSSDHVKQLAIESLNYEPDALIIYSGNNEYFQYMLELSAINPTWEPQNLYLEKLHLFRAVASIFTDKKESTELYESQKKQETLLLQQAIAQFGSVSENPFVRTDRITTQVNQRYIANLKQVLQTAKLQKVPVFIVLIPANLLHPPELSLHNPHLSGKERKKWQSQYDKAKKTDCGIRDLC